MNLKALTLENHKNAERSKFAGILLSGSIDPQLYYAYLCNQLMNYSALESKLPLGMLGLEDIARKNLIEEDMRELEDKYSFTPTNTPIMNSVLKYVEHVEHLSSKNPRGLLAHLYVRHFGDMYGGAIIASKVPSKGAMYKFENIDLLKERVRSLLQDDMAIDANECFEYAIKLFQELGDWYESKSAI